MRRYIESNFGSDLALAMSNSASSEAKMWENLAKTMVRTNSAYNVAKFIKTMKTNIGTSISSIKDWFISMSASISSTASRVAGAITVAFANIGTAISSAIASTKAYIVALFQKTSAVLATPVAGITLGKLIAIAVVSSAVIFVMYKIYKAIKKRNSDPVSEVAAAKGDLRRIKKSINESITFFGNMNYILREDAPDANDVTGSASMSMITKASSLALEMFNWITKRTVGGLKKVVSVTGDFLTNHPTFSTIVFFATCAIFAAMQYFPYLSPTIAGTVDGIRAGLA